MGMTIDDLLLNIKAVGFSSLVCQADIHSEAEKLSYQEKGYQVELTCDEFMEKFHVDPSCVWYTPSVSQTSLYFNPKTLAASLYPVDYLLLGMLPNAAGLDEVIRSREEEVSNDDYSGSISSLPDAMQLEYFKLLLEKKGPTVPGLYNLFISTYSESDYGFGNLSSDIVRQIVGAKSAEDKRRTEEVLRDHPDTLKIYRGGNTASAPPEQAYSWTLDINVANFFACRRGIGDGHIIEAEVSKRDVIEALLEERGESEIVVDPKNIRVLQRHSIKGLDFLKSSLPLVAPTYHNYLERMRSLEFAQSSDAHGCAHQGRVLLLSLLLAESLDLPPSDQKVLATAAIYHDTQRTHDMDDTEHGKAAKEYYKTSAKSPDPLVEFLCEYHCRPDEAGYSEIMHNRALSKNRARSKLLFDIFKDADALDRVRFGIRDLDLNQLRLPVSRELTLVARLCLEQVRIDMKEKRTNATLSEKIQRSTQLASEGKTSGAHPSQPAER